MILVFNPLDRDEENEVQQPYIRMRNEKVKICWRPFSEKVAALSQFCRENSETSLICFLAPSDTFKKSAAKIRQNFENMVHPTVY